MRNTESAPFTGSGYRPLEVFDRKNKKWWMYKHRRNHSVVTTHCLITQDVTNTGLNRYLTLMQTVQHLDKIWKIGLRSGEIRRLSNTSISISLRQTHTNIRHTTFCLKKKGNNVKHYGNKSFTLEDTCM